jgi:ABC-type sugar transport system ATPase subunit
MKIEVRDLVRKFDAYVALNRVSLDADDGELVALLGPSGSGKTTLLRIIAGLDFPDDGNVYFDGVDSTRLKIQKRQVGFVFQSYALFQHMSVFKNVAFGLEVMRGKGSLDKAEVRERVTELLQLGPASGVREPAAASAFRWATPTGCVSTGFGDQPADSSLRRAIRRFGRKSTQGTTKLGQGTPASAENHSFLCHS